MRKIMVIVMLLMVILLTGCSQIELALITVTKLNGELVEIQWDNMYSEWVNDVFGKILHINRYRSCCMKKLVRIYRSYA